RAGEVGDETARDTEAAASPEDGARIVQGAVERDAVADIERRCGPDHRTASAAHAAAASQPIHDVADREQARAVEKGANEIKILHSDVGIEIESRPLQPVKAGAIKLRAGVQSKGR